MEKILNDLSIDQFQSVHKAVYINNTTCITLPWRMNRDKSTVEFYKSQ